MLFLRQALSECAETPGITYVWIDIDTRIGVERQFGDLFYAPAWIRDQ
jgi:hypothetical protein